MKTIVLLSFLIAAGLVARSSSRAIHDQQDPTELRGHVGGVSGIAWSPDGAMLASAGLDHTVRLWDPDTGETIRVLRGHTHEVYAVAFATDGQHLASAGYDGRVLVWDADADEPVRELRVEGWSVALAFSPDGGRLAVGSQAGSIRLWDWRTGAIEKTLETRSPVDALAFSPDGSQLAAAFVAITVFETSTGKLVKTLSGHQGIVAGLRFSNDAEQLVSVCHDKTARVWDLRSGRVIRTLAATPDPSTEPSLPLAAMAVAADEATIALGGAARVVLLSKLETGAFQKALTRHRLAVTGLAFAPDGKRLASCSMDGTIRLARVE